jgi:hypothetical protein
LDISGIKIIKENHSKWAMKGKRDTEIGIAGIKVMGANYSMTHKRTDNEIKK